MLARRNVLAEIYSLVVDRSDTTTIFHLYDIHNKLIVSAIKNIHS